MTGSDQPLSPEEEEVHRLLAQSRHTGPTPPEVVARLDRVLDDLAHEPDRAAPVVDLARRRRRVASLLVAAAAVVVVGIGVAQLVPPDSGGDTSVAGASREQESADSNAAQPKTDAGVGADAAEPDGKPATMTPRNSQKDSALFELRQDHLTDDLGKLRQLDTDAQEPLAQAYRAGPRSADRAAGVACGAASWGRGRFVPVSYGGAPAVLVLRRPLGDTQVADVFLCGSEEPVRSVTLPAP
jgi:hypothetical protein